MPSRDKGNVTRDTFTQRCGDVRCDMCAMLMHLVADRRLFVILGTQYIYTDAEHVDSSSITAKQSKHKTYE